MQQNEVFRLRDLFGKPLGRTKLYQEIGSGRLKVRYAGSTPIVTAEDWQSFIASLPTTPTRGRPPRRDS